MHLPLFHANRHDDRPILVRFGVSDRLYTSSTCTNVPVHAWHPPPDDFGACNTFGHPPRSIPFLSSIWNLGTILDGNRTRHQRRDHLRRTQHLSVRAGHQHGYHRS